MSDQNGIFITKKQASISVAILLLLGLLIFIVGYFWGKQSMIDGFSEKTSQESFNDQVDYLLTMQSFAAKHGPLQDDKKEEEVENSSATSKNLPDALEETDADVTKKIVKQTNKEKAVIKTQESKVMPVSAEPLRYAAIAGFGKKQSAAAMVSRLKKHGIDVDIKTKISKSASGKMSRTWYQVVTKEQQMSDLTTIIDRIVSLEHVKRNDIKII